MPTNHARAHIQSRTQDKLARALHDETIARLEVEARNKALVTEVDALQYELSHLGQSRDSALALKAARETEVAKLKKVRGLRIAEQPSMSPRCALDAPLTNPRCAVDEPSMSR